MGTVTKGFDARLANRTIFSFWLSGTPTLNSVAIFGYIELKWVDKTTLWLLKLSSLQCFETLTCVQFVLKVASLVDRSEIRLSLVTWLGRSRTGAFNGVEARRRRMETVRSHHSVRCLRLNPATRTATGNWRRRAARIDPITHCVS